MIIRHPRAFDFLINLINRYNLTKIFFSSINRLCFTKGVVIKGFKDKVFIINYNVDLN